MLYPPAQREEYLDGVYELKAYDGNPDLLHLYQSCKNGTADITFCSDTTFSEDQYTITVDETGVRITHLGECGIFRALTSLRQLIKTYGKKLPYCSIEDWPDFTQRAYMLDISRGRVPKVWAICRLIDMLAELKYNEFQLYIESFVFDYKAYPQCTADFECLTPEDIEYLDGYCKARFIELVPNQNSLGHMRAWLERPEFRHLKIGAEGDYSSATLNPLLPESFELLSNIYESLLPHFTSGKVNIGLDEANELDKYELADVCKARGKDAVFMDWLCKVASHIDKNYGKKVQFWADMVYKYPDAFDRMPQDATALVWGYDVIPTTLYETRCRMVAEKGCDFYVCPGDITWKSMTGRFDIMAFNTRIAADAGKKYGAKGYMLTNWGNGGHMQFPLWGYVPMALAGLYAWNGGEFSHYSPKMHNVKLAQKYAEAYMLNAPIADILYKLQRYYMLEPERVHDRSIAFSALLTPLQEKVVIGSFDSSELNDVFYFENVIDYVEKVLRDVETREFDPEMKEQILCNAKTVILTQELMILRNTKDPGTEKLSSLIALADTIMESFDRLWEKENFSHGKEIFLGEVRARRNEIAALREELYSGV